MAKNTGDFHAQPPGQVIAMIKGTLETMVKFETTALANKTGDAAKSNYHKDLVALCLGDETIRRYTVRMNTVRILEEMLYDLRHTRPNGRLASITVDEYQWLKKHSEPLTKNPKCVLNLEHWTTPNCSCEGPGKPLFTAEECKQLGPQVQSLQKFFVDITLGKHTPPGPYEKLYDMGSHDYQV